VSDICYYNGIDFWDSMYAAMFFVMKFAASCKFTRQKIILYLLFPEALPQAEVVSGLQPDLCVFISLKTLRSVSSALRRVLSEH
jgi:hypothetical protein